MHNGSRSFTAVMLLAAEVLVTGCPAGGDGSTTDTTAATETTSGGTLAPDTDAPTTGSSSEPTSTSGAVPVPPACEDQVAPRCEDPVTKCKLDEDRDWFTLQCDNAPDHTNPGQEDMDGDGFGDIVDRCPVVASLSNTLDTDKDGVGNDCDVCGRQRAIYNKMVDDVPFYMRVRGIPSQEDADHDGVGDACDNCVRVANCQGFGDGPGLTPHVVGALADVEAAGCQDDADVNLVGDACEGAMGPDAAGPVGFLGEDDFDQDGLVNASDGCPRQPVARQSCQGDEDCPSGASCSAAQICNHADHDGDGVGDICDTCPWVSNPEQVTEAGAQVDDADGDFIGAACEQTTECAERQNARPLAFYDVSVNGFCCVTSYNGQPLVDPDGEPIDVAELPPQQPGVLTLPPGCEEALAHSGDGKAHPMKACHVEAPIDLWQYLCFMPAWDQELDGVPDECDLCPFAYDPSNAVYVDQEMKEWPNNGKYCNGEYSSGLLDPANMCMP